MGWRLEKNCQWKHDQKINVENVLLPEILYVLALHLFLLFGLFGVGKKRLDS